ncbi:hypothetical protein SAMN05216553_103131 [Lentzea fradiae]|uniref:Uncharacterized protein n=1 Tax=Lentzea fradiae TaxID=200378 RepID=A0A1G7NP24_9PSEU|nr:hypothetical protein [Lentzea fradiae]SDF75818.1 hypothetical protein SAMN05216553_103131 [Lentzea fradiae]
MLWLFSQMFLLCALAFAAGALVTWLSVRGRPRTDPPKPLLALPGPRLTTEKVVVDQPVARPNSVPLKGNSKTLVYHTADSPYYRRMKGDRTFASEAEAVAAGYRRWTTKSRVKV